jgi:hypothetical protein
MFTRTILATGFLFTLAASGFADLHWDKPIQDFKCTPDDRHAEAHYTFRNTGTTPVTVKSVQTSCGCTTARLDKKTYQPGEQGEVVATYSFHGATGALRKLITVISDDHPDQPMTLDLRVFVHEPFEVNPALVYWRTGDAADPKSVHLLANGYPVKVKSVTSSNPRIVVTLETVKPGEEYAVAVKPADTTQKEGSEISVLTDYPPESPRIYTIHARIK